MKIKFWHLAFSVLIWNMMLQIFSHVDWHGDGIVFLLDVLSRKEIMQWDPPRSHVHWITQFPVLAAAYAGVHSFSFLASIYSTLLAMWPPLAALAAISLLSERRPLSIFLTLLGLIVIQLNSGYFLISESHAATTCYLVVLFYLCRRPEEKAPQGYVLGVLLASLIGLRAYEFYAFFGLIIAIAAACRYCIYYQFLSLFEKILLLGLIVSHLLAAFIAWDSMLFSPNHQALERQPLLTIWSLVTDPQVFLSVSLFILIIVLFLTKGFEFKKKEFYKNTNTLKRHWGMSSTVRLKFLLGIIIGALLGCLPGYNLVFLQKLSHQYDARVLNLFVPLLLSIVLFAESFLSFKQPIQPLAQQAVWPMVMAITLIIWDLSWQTTVSMAWVDYRHRVEKIATSPLGVIALKEQPNIASSPFLWAFTLPSLCIAEAMQQNKPVRSLVDPSPQPYLPFELNNRQDYPDLQYLGGRYEGLP